MSPTAEELGARLRSGEDTCVALTRRALQAAEGGDAFVAPCPEQALESARRADRELAEGTDRGPLHGIPIGVKDNIDVAGAWTRLGTAAFGHRLADRDAAVIARLREAGAVVLGKTRTHELAWGMITEGCRNPRDPERIVGGSSGGSAAAVAAGIVPVALGTDTGGSVRNPAALCGVTGVKTAAGALPMDGIAPMAPTQDTAGVLGSGVADCRMTLECLGVRDSSRQVRRIGRIADTWAQRVEPEVSRATTDAIERLRGRGVEVVDVSVRHSELAPAAAYVIMLAEAARNWWPGDEQLPTGATSADVRDELRRGIRLADEDYGRALQVRAAVEKGAREALGEVDALLLPSCPVLANPIGRDEVECAGRTIPVAAAHSALTSLGSASGLPALSVPGDGEGLPTGIQLIGDSTATLTRCAELLEPTMIGTTTGSGR